LSDLQSSGDHLSEVMRKVMLQVAFDTVFRAAVEHNGEISVEASKHVPAGHVFYGQVSEYDLLFICPFDDLELLCTKVDETIEAIRRELARAPSPGGCQLSPSVLMIDKDGTMKVPDLLTEWEAKPYRFDGLLWGGRRPYDKPTLR
jgi:DNA-binding Lrp family transcriptional regulator